MWSPLHSVRREAADRHGEARLDGGTLWIQTLKYIYFDESMLLVL